MFFCEADHVFEECFKEYPNHMVDENQFLSKSDQQLKWFVLPSEALRHLKQLENFSEEATGLFVPSVTYTSFWSTGATFGVFEYLLLFEKKMSTNVRFGTPFD